MAIEKINATDTLNTGREKINKALDEAVTVLKEATNKDIISAPEIVVARGGASTLGERLDSEKAEVTAQLAQKASKGEVNNLVSSMQSGVKGTYLTLSDLQTNLPNGSEGNYIVQSDGHIYNWNGIVWVDTEIQYQSTGIAKESVSVLNLDSSLVEKETISEFDFENMILKYPPVSQIGRMIIPDTPITAQGSIVINLKISSDAELLVFLLEKEGSNFTIKQKDVVLVDKGDNQGIATGLYSRGTGGEYVGLIVPNDGVEILLYGDYNGIGYHQSVAYPLLTTNIGDSFEFNTRINGTFAISFSTIKIKVLTNDYVDLLGGAFTQGVVIDDGSIAYTPDIRTTDFVPVKPGEIYKLKGRYDGVNALPYGFYGIDKEFIPNSRKSVKVNGDRLIKIPDNVFFIRMSFMNSDIHTFGLILVTISDGLITQRMLASDINVDIKRKWANAKANFLGDSITAGTNTTKIYHEYLAENISLSVARNYGIGGSRIADGSTPMYSRALTMDVDADLVFVFGGTNDFNSDTTLGSLYTLDENGKRIANVNTTTFYGALHQLCINLMTRFAGKQVILMTPIHREVFNTQHLDTEPNDKGVYLDEFIKAIKEVGEWYSIPVLDLYAESGLQPNIAENKALYFSPTDGLHPKAEGHAVIANKIEAFLNTI